MKTSEELTSRRLCEMIVGDRLPRGEFLPKRKLASSAGAMLSNSELDWEMHDENEIANFCRDSVYTIFESDRLQPLQPARNHVHKGWGVERAILRRLKRIEPATNFYSTADTGE